MSESVGRKMAEEWAEKIRNSPMLASFEVRLPAGELQVFLDRLCDLVGAVVTLDVLGEGHYLVRGFRGEY